MTPENEKYFKDTKKTTNSFLDDFHEYLEIISEFKSNPYLKEFHTKVVSEVCKTSLMVKESLYVITIRRLAEMVQTLTMKLDSDGTYQSMLHYKSLYEETAKKLEQSEKNLKEISKIINRGDTVE